jgi:hypothetical protein
MNSRQLRHVARAPINWIGHTLSNTWGVANVFDMVWLRPMQGGLLDSTHPFVAADQDEEAHWRANLVFASPSAQSPSGSEDEKIVAVVMAYMRNIAASSAAQPGYPAGRPSRMPPAVNAIHGSVHRNGVSMLFDDPRDVVRHFTDRRFARELRQFIRAERREITVILRDKDYDREELGELACFVKTVVPYWANPNGNKKRIHWGVPAPYPNINLITGAWIRDTRMLLTATGRARVPRAPIERGRWFRRGPYVDGWSEFLAPERALARATTRRVHARGEKGGMYFTDARKLKAGFLYDPEHLPTLPVRIVERVWARARRVAARVFR